MLKKLFIIFISIIFVGIGVALTIVASVGVGSWDAMAQTASVITNTQIGTIGIILNCFCVFGQFIILRKEFSIRHVLQIPFSIILGIAINIALVTIIETVPLDIYWHRYIVLVIGYIVAAFGVAIVMSVNLVTFALEGLCVAAQKVLHIPFYKIRQIVDIICILLVIVVALLLNLEIYIREGTIIGMLIFGPLLGLFTKIQRPILKKLNVIEKPSAKC